MAFTFIASAQGAAEAAGTTLDTTTSLNVQAGDVLVCWVKHEGAPSSTFSVADSTSGNDFQFDAGDKTDHSNNDLSTSFGYVLSASADASFTGRFTTLSRAFRTIQVWQFRPDVGETVTKDASNDAQGSGTSINSGNISTTGDDVIVLGGYGEYTANNSSAHQIGGTNATAVLQSQSVGANFTASWYRILSATMSNGAATCTNASADWTGGIIALKSEVAVRFRPMWI